MDSLNLPKVRWSKPFEEDEFLLGEEPNFFGQEGIKQQLMPFLSRKGKFPHCLFIGEPGIGKTQLAQWIAYTLKKPFTELLAPVKPWTMPRDGTVLIDEAHRQRHPEPLFALMKDIEGPVILAATTRPEKLEPAFASRFMQYRLDRYSHEDMVLIVRNLATHIEKDEADILASASAGNPRQAIKLMDVADGLGSYEPEDVLTAARITAQGLTEFHLRVMVALRSMERPVGLQQLSVLLFSHPDTVGQAERYLFEEGYVKLTTTGRQLTEKGNQYLEHIEN